MAAFHFKFFSALSILESSILTSDNDIDGDVILSRSKAKDLSKSDAVDESKGNWGMDDDQGGTVAGHLSFIFANSPSKASFACCKSAIAFCFSAISFCFSASSLSAIFFAST